MTPQCKKTVELSFRLAIKSASASVKTGFMSEPELVIFITNFMICSQELGLDVDTVLSTENPLPSALSKNEH
jgi:hypothetical protein